MVQGHKYLQMKPSHFCQDCGNVDTPIRENPCVTCKSAYGKEDNYIHWRAHIQNLTDANRQWFNNSLEQKLTIEAQHRLIKMLDKDDLFFNTPADVAGLSPKEDTQKPHRAYVKRDYDQEM